MSTRTLTQEDPIGLAGGLNLYGFAGGDPINFSDPYGLKTCPPDCGSIHAISAAAFGYIGAVGGAAIGATAGTLALPGGGTVSGGYVGGVGGAAAGAAFGVTVANAVEVAVDAGATVVNAIRVPKPIRKVIEVAGGVIGFLTGNPPPRPPEPEPPRKEVVKEEGASPPPPRPKEGNEEREKPPLHEDGV